MLIEEDKIKEAYAAAIEKLSARVKRPPYGLFRAQYLAKAASKGEGNNESGIHFAGECGHSSTTGLRSGYPIAG